jgi:hypothetical protein
MRCMKQLMLTAALALALGFGSARGAGSDPDPSAAPAQARAGGSDCVTIGIPKPTKTYVMSHVENNGKSTTVSQIWERVDEKGSRLKWTGPAGSWLQVNDHHIVDDVAVLDRTAKLGLNEVVTEATTFSKPGLVADPAFRACPERAGRFLPSPPSFNQGR